MAKIETVSKTYLLCAGVLEAVDDHAAAMIDCSLEIMNMVSKQFGRSSRVPVVLRIGIATGNVVCALASAFVTIWEGAVHSFFPDVPSASLLLLDV